MATLRDVRPVFRAMGVWPFIKRIYQQINEDNILVWAASMAYSWLFAIFPFLILLLSLVPYLPSHARHIAQRKIAQSISSALGSAAPTINDNIQSILTQPRRGWLGIGLCVSLWVASGGIAMTMSAMDQCYDLENKDMRPFYKQRPIAILLTILIAAMVLALFVLLPVTSALQHWLPYFEILSQPVKFAFELVRYAMVILLMLMILAIIYHFGPNIRQRFHAITPGAVFSLSVWLILDLLFRLYIDKYARYDQMYGTVGGAAILLFFFYIIALVLLIGGEINSEIDFVTLGVKPGSRDFKTPAKRL
ncbi:MAG: YihY/virulence factor BrkB family protein [Tepidisphaeraceae bacterium]